MSKKSLEKKAGQKIIAECRDKGKSDQEIYNELVPLYFDKKAIALLITGTVTKENKAKYKVFNTLLLVLLGLGIVSRLLLAFSLAVQTKSLLAYFLILIFPLFWVFFAVEIARYSAPIYRFCGIMTIVGFTQTINNVANSSDFAINLAFATAIAVLSFYLDSKMFPNYRPNKLQTDSNGEYILL